MGMHAWWEAQWSGQYGTCPKAQGGARSHDEASMPEVSGCSGFSGSPDGLMRGRGKAGAAQPCRDTHPLPCTDPCHTDHLASHHSFSALWSNTLRMSFRSQPQHLITIDSLASRLPGSMRTFQLRRQQIGLLRKLRQILQRSAG